MKSARSTPLVPQWIIEKKRDGLELTEDEIRFFVDGYSRGDLPDYQMAALAMAIYFRGMTPRETAILTDAMMHSGKVVDTSAITRPKVDKHSTGGIGDKVSLVLAPLVAACGVAVPMISGRGLGITGGTLDKLESIPGYRTNLSETEFLEVVKEVGCSIIGQTRELAPADKKLYALRDVTGTVPSIPLITASIMCKKLAEGIDALVLDVKVGKGAFMRTVGEARELARSMVRVGKAMGKGMRALITDMNQPLGRTAGNALEVRESIETLRGEGPKDLTDLTLALAEEMLLLGKVAPTRVQARRQLQAAIANGSALSLFRRMVECQGGDVRVIDDPGRLPAARWMVPYPSPTTGYVAIADAEAIGKACVVLGAGRTKTDDSVDHAVGVSGIRKIGEFVRRGEPLLLIHANDEQRLEKAKELLKSAFKVQKARPRPPKLILQRI
ncbi:MAG: thymidine phosphorylase [Kiritimatiellae bacterium]|nr:thymidine phosphorylase [Kiritimatiellia bacterium]MDW8458579.1 thymidine phosphorylase [Verrucomicrobiota bacterium]